MDASKYRRLLREGDQSFDKDFGGVRGMKEALKKIKAISDLEEQKKEAKRIWKIHDTWHPRRLTVSPPSEVRPSESYGLFQYENLLEELKKISEGVKKINKTTPTSPIPPKEKPKTTKEIPQNNNHSESIFCEQCFKQIETGKKYFYKKGKKNEKLCSQECFLAYHGELCHKCCNQFLTVYQHWNKKEFPDTFYCSECYDVAKQEEQEDEERFAVHCRYCSAKTESILGVCEKQSCLDKMTEEIDNKYRNNNNNSDNPQQSPSDQSSSSNQPDNKPSKIPQEKQESPSNNQSPTSENDNKNNWLPPVLMLGELSWLVV